MRYAKLVGQREPLAAKKSLLHCAVVEVGASRELHEIPERHDIPFRKYQPHLLSTAFPVSFGMLRAFNASFLGSDLHVLRIQFNRFISCRAFLRRESRCRQVHPN